MHAQKLEPQLREREVEHKMAEGGEEGEELAAHGEGSSSGGAAAPASMDGWELSKENYVPVKTGRHKAALAELSSADPADGTTRIALEQRRRFAVDLALLL